MSSKSNQVKEIIKSAQSKGLEVVSNAIATAQHHADLMSPSDVFATVCTLTAVLIASYQILQHLCHYNEPQVQLQVIRILMIIPVFSISTWFSIIHPELTLTLNTIRDCYEAYVLYIFMQLLVQFLGGESQLIVHLEFKRRIKQPWPFDKLQPLQTDKLFFRNIKKGVLQFVLIKPITAVLAIILDSYGLYCDGEYELNCGYLWLSFVNNMSVTISLYSLVLFYMATEERLAPFNPFYKFMSVKAILFFSFWQTCAFQMLQLTGVLSRDTGNQLLNLITCAEMVLCAVAQSIAFSYTSHLDCTPVRSESSFQTRKQKQPGFCDGLFSLLTSTTDVIDDTRNTFIKSYDDEEGDKETQLDELMRLRDSFNWSDEELLDVKDRAKKGKHNKNNLPKVKTLSMLQSIKKTVKGNDFQLKRRKSDSDGSLAEEAQREGRDVELQDRSQVAYKTPDEELEIRLDESEPVLKQSTINPLSPGFTLQQRK